MKKLWIALLIGLMVFAVVLQQNVPMPINWNPDFRSTSNEPYGLSAFYEILPQLYPDSEIYRAEITAFEDSREADVLDNKNYISISETFAPDDLSAQALLEHIGNGNRAFIAAQNFGGLFTEYLGFDVDKRYAGESAYPKGNYFGPSAASKRWPRAEPGSADADDDEADADASGLGATVYSLVLATSNNINLINPDLRLEGSVWYQSVAGQYCFTELEEGILSPQVLGRNQYGEANFLRFKWGDGELYVSTVPFAFSNFNILHADGLEYATRAISYMPARDFYWDGYYSAGVGDGGMMSAVMSAPALAGAFRTALFFTILFMLFSAKRRQRIIPIVRPPANATLGFVSMVGELYHQRGDNHGAATKKIRFLLEHIRRRYYLRTNVLDQDFRQALALKSGVELADIEDLFKAIDLVSKSKAMSPERLVKVCQMIDSFYINSQN